MYTCVVRQRPGLLGTKWELSCAPLGSSFDDTGPAMYTPQCCAQEADLASGRRANAADATLVSMAVEPVDEVRNHLSDIIDRVELRRERVTVTRDGRPVAVILSPEDPAELEETISVLSDPQALPDIREADAASATGDVVRGVDAVRALRP